LPDGVKGFDWFAAQAARALPCMLESHHDSNEYYSNSPHAPFAWRRASEARSKREEDPSRLHRLQQYVRSDDGKLRSEALPRLSQGLAADSGVMTSMQVLRLIVAALLTVYFLRQVRKPGRFAGRFFLWMMNKSHSRLTDWGLQHIRIETAFTVLDVGCGGGRTIQKLAAIATDGKVFGVDYAAGSVAASRAKNAGLIREGRVEVKQASVSHLPFDDAQFDVVTAIETQYYWSDLTEDMREILRVLKPAGTLAIILETYRKGARDKVLGPAMKLIGGANLSVEEQRQLFAEAGYTDIAIFEEHSKGWLCATGKKPAGVLPATRLNEADSAVSV
jgi:SAM-dependent methyltransferase